MKNVASFSRLLVRSDAASTERMSFRGFLGGFAANLVLVTAISSGVSNRNHRRAEANVAALDALFQKRSQQHVMNLQLYEKPYERDLLSERFCNWRSWHESQLAEQKRFLARPMYQKLGPPVSPAFEQEPNWGTRTSQPAKQ